MQAVKDDQISITPPGDTPPEEGITNAIALADSSVKIVVGAETNSSQAKEALASQESNLTGPPEIDPWALPELQDDGIPWKELNGKGKVLRVFIGITKAICLLLLLYTFICSLDFLSSAFRLVGGKSAGEVMSKTELLKNPIVGLMLGVLATVILQSSSTSTSIVITMVGADLLKVHNAIPIIMGANIGTSITNTFVSFSQVTDRNEFRRAFAAATVHDMFNWLSVIVLLPLEVGTGYLEKATDAIMNSTDWKQNKGMNKAFLSVITKPFTSLIIQLDKKVLEGFALNSSAYANASFLKQCYGKNSSAYEKCGYLMEYFSLSDVGTGVVMLTISLIMLCTCVVFIVKLLNSVLKGRIAVIIKKIINAEPRFPLNYLVGYAAMVIGCGVTIIVQSSSVFTSALTPLAGVGVITTERMYPLTLGSNVGTTTTGILAALAADPKRLKYTLQIAFCHLLFNVTGIVLFYPIPFMRWPIYLAKQLGNITAKYRWFSVLYIIFMFVFLPCTVFGLSVAGQTVFMAIGIPIIVVIILIVIINLIQRSRPSLLPLFLRNWNWLPECLHSLDPLDRIMIKLCHFCKCCRSIQSENAHDGQVLGIRPNTSKVHILEPNGSPEDKRHPFNGMENSAFMWKLKAENTKL